MAAVDVGRQSDILPTINHLDLEKIKKENSAYIQRLPSSLNMTAPTNTSPRTMYSGPPPPYSYPSSTTGSVVGGLTGYISPPESRRTLDDEKEPLSLPRTILLPSIHEALGSEKSMAYSSIPRTIRSPPAMATISPHDNPPPAPRTYTEPIPQGPPNPFASVQSSTSFLARKPPERQPQPNYGGYSHAEYPPSRYSAVNSPVIQPPSQTPRTIPSPVSATRPTFYSFQRHQHPPPPCHPPYPVHPVNPPYTYTSTPPASSYPPPTSSIHAYQPPPLPPPHWHCDGPEPDRAEEVRRRILKGSPPGGQTFGESVKRHLDIFDLETSLNEIAEGSGRALEFSRHYGVKAHNIQRAGLSPITLPNISDCEAVIRQQNRVLDAMVRIKEVIITQQNALAEQRSQEQGQRGSHGPDDDDLSAYGEKADGSGGFAGSDMKKRRGRAAPPGRCHSCNRAETPEWRRGPDGARTLCNACGLHYAKLTRKMGPKATMSSNIRPKDPVPASPQ